MSPETAARDIGHHGLSSPNVASEDREMSLQKTHHMSPAEQTNKTRPPLISGDVKSSSVAISLLPTDEIISSIRKTFLGWAVVKDH